MDQQFENGIFSDFERQQLSQGYIFSPLLELNTPKLSQDIDIQPITLQSRKPSLDLSQIPIVNQYPSSQIKAFNPFQMVQRMAPQKQKQYMRIANNSKNFNGLQFFFQAQNYYEGYQDKQSTFLQGINQRVFNYDQEVKSGDLDKLFSIHQIGHQSEKDHIRNLIINLRGKMSQSQEKCFSSIMLNKTIGPAFYEHFQNFSFVSNPVNFLQDLQVNLTNFIHNAKRLKSPGYQLIYSIYEFWIKTFKDFVNQIWKYSSKYTLNFFKKQKVSQASSQSQSTSKTTNRQSESRENKEKRKNWNSDQIRILQKIIQSNVIFSQNKLKQLSEELGRSVNSISSKIQKIIKSKKGEQYQQDSLLKKTIEVLKLSPQGLTKDITIEKINEYYEMGYDGQWQKSVGQLLSSRKQFNKIKGKYRLINGQRFQKMQGQEQNTEKMTFRDKVVKCFLKFQNYEADLKSLIQIYINLYGEQEDLGANNQQRRKSVQASISKTLSRYDIFDTTNSKTLYQYQGNANQTIEKFKNQQQSYENFINI